MQKLLVMMVILAMPSALVMSDAKEEINGAKKTAVRVAVMDFKNLSMRDEHNQSCVTMSKLLNVDLANTPGIIVLERERLGEVLRETGLSDFSDQQATSKAQKALDADYLLEGSLKLADNKLVYHFNLLSLKDGKPALTGEISGNPDDLLSLEQKIFADVKKTLDAPALPVEKVEAPKEVRLAIVPFENLSPQGRSDKIVEVLRYTIEAGLSNLPKIFLVTRDQLNEIAAEQKLALNGLSSANAVKVGKLADADYLLHGDVTVVGEDLRADLRIVKVATGKVAFVKTSSGKVSELSAVNDKLCAEILEGINFALSLGERESLRQANQASREAMRHFYEAIRLSKGNPGAVGKDEVQALERVLYLDALDAGAEIYLVDQLLESEMFPEAEQRVRKALNMKLPSETRAAFLHRLAQTYTEKKQIPVLWHIAKNFPNTPAATEAYWFLGNLYLNYPEFHNLPMARLCLERARKDPETLYRLFPKYYDPCMDVMSQLRGMLNRTNSELGFGVSTETLESENIDKYFEELKKRNYPTAFVMTKEVEEFIVLSKRAEWDAALEKMKKSGKFGDVKNPAWSFPYCSLLLTAFKLSNQQAKADALLDWWKEDFLASNPDLKKWDWQLKCLDNLIAAQKKYPVYLVEEPQTAPLPETPPNRPVSGLERLPENIPPEALNTVLSAIDKNPDDPVKAYYQVVNSGQTYPAWLSLMITVYAHLNQPSKAVVLFENQVKNHSIPNPEGYLSNSSLIKCHLARREYGKALKGLGTSDDFESVFASVRIRINKLGDYAGALQYLQQHYGNNFSYIWERGMPDKQLDRTEKGEYSWFFAKNGRRPSRVSRALSDDIDFWAAKCFEGLNDYERAYIEYGRLLQYPEYIVHAENAIEAQNRLPYLEKHLREKQKQPLWKVGDWWEGVQGWYLTSPDKKNLADGWVFTDLYFEVSGLVRHGVFACYALDIYPMTRAELLALCQNKPEKKAEHRFVTVYITVLTNTPCGILPGKAWKIEPTAFFFPDLPSPITSHYMSLNFGYFTLVPFVENKHLPPVAELFFTEPFQTMMPVRLCNTTKYSDAKLAVNGKDAPRRRGQTTWDVNYELMAYTECDPNVLESEVRFAGRGPHYDVAKALAIASPHREQVWSNAHGWWLRDAEFNPWYVEGKSPANAKYSKLFVLTCRNGEKVSVDTGLPGPASDITALRVAHKKFDENCPYDAQPSREMIELFKAIMVENTVNGREIMRRGKVSLQYMKEIERLDALPLIENYLQTGKFPPYDTRGMRQILKYPEEDNPNFLNRPNK